MIQKFFKTLLWTGVIVTTSLAAEAIDVEILKNLDFYSAFDVVQDLDLVQDAEAVEALTDEGSPNDQSKPPKQKETPDAAPQTD